MGRTDPAPPVDAKETPILLIVLLLSFSAVAADLAHDLGELPTPGSNWWDSAVAFRLVVAYDLNRSGDIDRKKEVAAISCDVWQVLDTRTDGLVVPYGFREDLAYEGHSIGIDPRVRRHALSSMRGCGLQDRQPDEVHADDGAHAADILAFIFGAEGGEMEEMLIQATLFAEFDKSGDGSIDQPYELEAVPCEVWHVIDVARGHKLRERYGVDLGSEWNGGEVGIDASLRQLWADRLDQCGVD